MSCRIIAWPCKSNQLCIVCLPIPKLSTLTQICNGVRLISEIRLLWQNKEPWLNNQVKYKEKHRHVSSANEIYFEDVEEQTDIEPILKNTVKYKLDIQCFLPVTILIDHVWRLECVKLIFIFQECVHRRALNWW